MESNFKKSVTLPVLRGSIRRVSQTHKKIGRPLNVALRLSSLGIDTQITSRIGNNLESMPPSAKKAK
jgi:hypothetical protein